MIPHHANAVAQAKSLMKSMTNQEAAGLGLDYDEDIKPKLDELRIECNGKVCRRLSDEELKAKLLAKPSALAIEVRGAYKTGAKQE